MTRCIFKTALAAIALLLLPSLLPAQNLKLSGPHFNLNIIGVEKGKNADMRNSDRHTIFVPLNNSDGIGTKIYLVPGSDFAVCDGNGFDEAVDCAGNYKGTGAVFMLPCNTNIPNDQQSFVPCDQSLYDAAQVASYSVYARALGQPGGQATLTTCATDTFDGSIVCSTESAVIARPYKGGTPQWKDVTNALSSIVTCYDPAYGYGLDACATGKTVRVALFSGGLIDWFWNYYNKGLRLAQIRFYLQ